MKIELTDPHGYTGYGNSSVGAYIVVNSSNVITEIKRCRVEFEWARKRANFHKRVGFKKDNLNFELIRDFWNKIFRKLGKKSKFEINESNFSDIFVIDLPRFWNKNDTVQSLFSLLLRYSTVYYKGGDVFGNMNDYILTARVIPAIRYFLGGYTIPTYEKLTTRDQEGYVGFVAEFERLSEKEIAQKLVKRIKKTK